VLNLLPAGFKGIVVSGLLAALMSSLSSVFNSCSTLFTVDIYKRYKPKASEKELVWVGQLATGALVALGLAWIPMMDAIEGGLFKQLQSVQAYISPPIAAVFLLGIFSRRINAKGAMAALYTGFVLGVARLAMEPFKDDLSGILFTFADINFLHFAILLFVICSAILVGVSLSTAPPDVEKIRNITFGETGDEVKKEPANRTDVILTIILAIILASIWIVFA
jgi:SSS family solute:Na+ symporter